MNVERAVPVAAAQRMLPRAEYWELVAACRQLTDSQARSALRTRLMPFILMPGETLYVAAGRSAHRLAHKNGVEVVATADADTMLAALTHVFGARILENARFHLARSTPLYSAARRFTISQTVTGLMAAALIATGFFLVPGQMAIFAAFMFSLLFLGVAGLRLASLMPARNPPLDETCPPAPGDLPVYTIFVPLFRETRVIDQLLRGLAALNYPQERLDIKIILERSDTKTIRFVEGYTLPDCFEIIIVPDCDPQTKPKALNYALHFARGDLAVIFDAEDIPEPDQLLRAASAFAAAPEDIVCLQARLTFYNAAENWLTRQFTIEYAILFDLLLPMLADSRTILPLGGTSNHFRMKALRKLGGWDPFNVTEDADLGVRLARFGWRSGVISSSTFEEASSTLGNWLHQRARWLKGWMQTWLVHMRSPLVLWRETGPGGFVIFQLLTAGIIVSTLVHPLFTAAIIWALVTGKFFLLPASPGDAILAGAGLAVLVAGYGFAMWTGIKALNARRLYRFRPAVLAMPLYWQLISLAGWLALWQFITRPHHWNKTRHGLSRLLRKR